MFIYQILKKVIKKERKGIQVQKKNISGGCTGVFFPPDVDEVYSISEWYAGVSILDSEYDPYCRELQISLTPSDWYKFQEQDFYQDLMQYLNNLKIQKQNKLLDEAKDSQANKEFQ